MSVKVKFGSETHRSACWQIYGLPMRPLKLPRKGLWGQKSGVRTKGRQKAERRAWKREQSVSKKLIWPNTSPLSCPDWWSEPNIYHLKVGKSKWMVRRSWTGALWENTQDVHKHTHFEVSSHLTLELCLLVRPTVFHILWNLFSPSAPRPYFHLSFPSTPPLPLHTYPTLTHTLLSFCWRVKKMTPAVISPSKVDHSRSEGLASHRPSCHHGNNTDWKHTLPF